MNIFTIKVGKITRRGNFLEQYRQTVSAPYDIQAMQLYNYFIIGLLIIAAIWAALIFYNKKNWWKFSKRFRRRK